MHLSPADLLANKILQFLQSTMVHGHHLEKLENHDISKTAD